MNYAVKKLTTSIVLPADDDPYAEIAAEGGGQFGKILKYVKGDWSHANTTMPLGTEFLVLMPAAMRGDVRFQDGRPVEHRIGLIRDRAKFASRAELGFLDRELWEKNNKGEPIDPWSQQTYLPMIHQQSGDLYCFVFRSSGAKQTFRDLCKAYSPFRMTRTLPIVSLQSDRYNHPDYSWIDTPILRIERWEADGVGEELPEPDRNAENAKVVGESKVGADMHDDIPF
jgi:hypothetical protein